MESNHIIKSALLLFCFNFIFPAFLAVSTAFASNHKVIGAEVHAVPVDSNADNSSVFRIEMGLHKSCVLTTDKNITRISIAAPEIADATLVTPRQVLIVSQKEIGMTHLILWHGKEDDDSATVYEIDVHPPGHDMNQFIQAQLDQLGSDTGNIRILKATIKEIVLGGEVDNQETLDRVLRMLKDSGPMIKNLITVRQSQQVQLEVKIAEVSRSGMKQMGMGVLNNNDWSIGVFPVGGAAGSINKGKDISSSYFTNFSHQETAGETQIIYNDQGIPTGTVEIPGRSDDLTNSSLTDTITNTDALTSIINMASPFASAYQIALHSANDDIMGILSILKGQGLSRILANPTLVTMSGQPADFLVGGEFPVPKTGSEGETQIEYKKFGVMLNFTPTVVGRETITLKVQPEVSQPDYSMSVVSGGVAVPGLKTRRGITTLQLKDGQTFAMAGLMMEDSYTVINKIPFLGDLPILGTLFTSKEYQKNETELVIIVTPRLVKALNPDEVPPLPGEDDLGVISDTDFFLLNKLNSNEKTERPPEKTDHPEQSSGFAGEIGFSE